MPGPAAEPYTVVALAGSVAEDLLEGPVALLVSEAVVAATVVAPWAYSAEWAVEATLVALSASVYLAVLRLRSLECLAD